MIILKWIYEHTVLYLKGEDKPPVKRGLALAVIAFLLAWAISPMWKTCYGMYYVVKNNLAPAAISTLSSPAPRTPNPLVVDNERGLPALGPPAPRRTPRVR